MKNVLIPSDLTPVSAELAGRVARAIDDRVNIFLFHAFDIPDSLVDAMVRMGGGGHYGFITEELRLKCRKVKKQTGNIDNISFGIMYGSTDVAFRNYAEANRIDLIALPEGYRFIPLVRDSVNPLRMFKRSGIEIMTDLRPVTSPVTATAKEVAEVGTI
ncbi:hypothetical protein GCM10023093_08080 [Nemorincola caseinilytica]|uniref:Universal stress protein n=1 Tax=Nemorincola caseinilytica TaxID=2054315 RepID=A0ABP8N976_9BACT